MTGEMMLRWNHRLITVVYAEQHTPDPVIEKYMEKMKENVLRLQNTFIDEIYQVSSKYHLREFFLTGVVLFLKF